MNPQSHIGKLKKVRRFYICLITLFLFVFSYDLFSQESGLIKIEIPAGVKDFELKDSLLVPNSVIVICGSRQLKFRNEYQIIQNVRVTISFSDSVINFDKIMYYRLFYRNAFNPIYKRNSSEIQKKYDPILGKFSSNSNIFRNGNEINVTGVVSRGVGLGNAQNLSLNSALNIQITGKLDNDIEISAAISDEQYPSQPEGTTLQVQDFDKVYVQLSKKNQKLIFGDFLMETDSSSYFLKYYKKSRGINYSLQNKKGSALNGLNSSAAISRGRFSRNEISGIDGIQGPYRLKGTNDEQFIIVISGTETVHLDGLKLTRGLQNDYVIDYNTGEILFNTNHLITGFSRIVVEFQFADRNYSRTVLAANIFHKTSDFEIAFHLFNEKDLKTQPLQQDLEIYDSTKQKTAKQLLENAGDNPDSAAISNVRRYNYFDNTSLNYIKKDSGGFVFYRFAGSNGKDSQFYKVEFSYIGIGKGNYVIKQSSANGRIYEFIPPISGIKQGEYEPIVILVPPSSLTVSNLSLKYSPNKASHLKLEVAGSSQDKNTLSKKDDNNNFGLGVLFMADNTLKLKHNLFWKNSFKYEHSGAGFRYPERYRNVEFERQWQKGLTNPSSEKQFVDENIIDISSKLIFFQKSFVEISSPMYSKGGISDLINPKFKSHVDFGNFFNENEGELLRTLKYSNINVNAYMLSSRFGFVKNNTSALIEYTKERSLIKSDTNFSLNTKSYKYNQARFSFNQSTKKLLFDLNAWNRIDFQPNANLLKETGKTYNVSAGLRLINKSKKGRLYLNLSYRDVEISDSALSLINGGNTLLTRIENEFHWLKNSISWTGFLQSGNGREQKRQYTYLEVPVGTGYFAWVDYNNNGIKEVNEFEVATFNDQARYVRLFLPSAQYITARYIDINQTINLRPSAVNEEGFWSKFENLTSLSMNLKSLGKRTELIKTIANPFGDTQTLSNLYFFRNTLFYNRAEAKSGAEFIIQNNGSKQLLQNGYEQRKASLYSLNFRFNFLSSLTLMLNGEFGDKSYTSEFFALNNYKYHYYLANPQLTWQYLSKLRISLINKSKYTGSSSGFGNDQGIMNDYTALFRYSDVNSGQLEASFSYISITFKGNPSSPLGFDFMQGLSPGNNIRWGAGAKKRIGKNILLDLQYNARKSSGSKVIHSGKMEVKYIF